MKIFYILTVLFAAFFISCETETGTEPVNSGLASFDIDFAEGTDLGTISNPLPAADEYSFVINITARNYDGTVNTDERVVEVKFLTATKTPRSPNKVTLENGVAKDITVIFKRGVEQERIVVMEIEQDKTDMYDGTSKNLKTGISGVSDTIYIPHASISTVQSAKSPSVGSDSYYEGRNLNLFGEKNRDLPELVDDYGEDERVPMVVTSILDGGFTLQQVGRDDYSAIYLYTHSSPFVSDVKETKLMEAGTLIEKCNGSVFSFYGFNELSFPTFDPVYDENGNVKIDKTLIPPATNIDSILGDSDEMEKKESMVVEITDVAIGDFPDNDSSYLEYGQYPIVSNGTTILLVTMGSVPSFDPLLYRGEGVTLCKVKGILKQHRVAKYGISGQTWILAPRDDDDLVFVGDEKCSE